MQSNEVVQNMRTALRLTLSIQFALKQKGKKKQKVYMFKADNVYQKRLELAKRSDFFNK